MKACIIQPPYSRDVSFSDEYFNYKIKLLDECDNLTDIIVLPEYSDIPVCVGHDFSRNWAIVDRAIELSAEKVQFFKPYFNQEMIDKAHANGIKCNVFYADTMEEAKRYIQMGVDTVLTNNYLEISRIIK